MTAQLAPHRMAVPPPAAPMRSTIASRASRSPSAMVFATTITFAAIAVVMAAALIAISPRTVTIPLAVVFVTGLVASGIVVTGDRGLTGRRHQSGGDRRPAPPDATGQPPGGQAHIERRADVPACASGWATLGGVSVTLLVLALVAPAGLRVALTAAGLVGLGAFRLGAMSGGWMSRGAGWSVRAEAPPALDACTCDEDSALRRSGLDCPPPEARP
jgi:hypothetical protein